MVAKYPAVPQATTDVESLRVAVLALKEIVETLTLQRGLPVNAAVTWGDLVNLGLITSAQVPTKLGNR